MDKIKQAIVSDCERIIEAFVSSGNYEFESFCKEWKRMQFHHIYSAILRDVEILQMTEVIFTAINRILFENSYLTGQKIGALYLMYAIFFKQPTEEYIKFKITSEKWKQLKDFIQSIADDPNTLQVRYIFYKLLAANAFRFVVLEEDFGLEQSLNRFMFKKNAHEQSASSFDDDVNELAHPTKGYLESLSVLEGGYNEMKRIMNQSEENTNTTTSFQKLDISNFMEKIKSSFDNISDLLKNDAEKAAENENDANESDSSYERQRVPVKRKATILEKRANIRKKAYRRRKALGDEDDYDISISGDMIQISKEPKHDNRVRTRQQNIKKLFSQELPDDVLNELDCSEELPSTSAEVISAKSEGMPVII